MPPDSLPSSVHAVAGYGAYTVTCPACAGSGRGESVTLGDPSCPVCAGVRRVEVVPAEQLWGAVDALREIATRPTMERNPDGDEQAAYSMQMIARGALDTFGRR